MPRPRSEEGSFRSGSTAEVTDPCRKPAVAIICDDDRDFAGEQRDAKYSLDVTGEIMRPYRNFLLMILVASVLMFCLMYLNTYQLGHVWFSQTRMFMTFIMAGSMALVMLFFMRHMYKDKRVNLAIVVGSIALIGLGFWLVRSQTTVGDVAWMKAMIPHHSIAILTSERARISNPRVRKLADEIIETQRREISEMEFLINDIKRKPLEAAQQ